MYPSPGDLASLILTDTLWPRCYIHFKWDRRTERSNLPQACGSDIQLCNPVPFLFSITSRTQMTSSMPSSIMSFLFLNHKSFLLKLRDVNSQPHQRRPAPHVLALWEERNYVFLEMPPLQLQGEKYNMLKAQLCLIFKFLTTWWMACFVFLHRNTKTSHYELLGIYYFVSVFPHLQRIHTTLNWISFVTIIDHYK